MSILGMIGKCFRGSSVFGLGTASKIGRMNPVVKGIIGGIFGVGGLLVLGGTEVLKYHEQNKAAEAEAAARRRNTSDNTAVADRNQNVSRQMNDSIFAQ